MVRWQSRLVRAGAFLAALCACTPTLSAQQPRGLDLGGAIVPGGEEITYLRALSLLDTIRVPFFAQPFGQWSEDRLRRWAAAEGNAHPWRARFVEPADRPVRRLGAVEWDVLRPEVQLVYNSALPSTRNDGVVWAGRGATTVAQAGIRARWGALSVQLAPIGFVAQNADYAIAANGRTGPLTYAEARYPHQIDAPQRFGDGRYGRLDPGESFIAVERSGLTIGLSTSRIAWGPGREENLVFSTNAGGFPHVFAGTARPLDVHIGTINGRLIGGKLAQSPYSIVQTGPEARFTSAFVGSFSPKLWPGLEVGGMRVMQARWRDGGPTLSEIIRPFTGIINNPETGAVLNQVQENGYASLFARLAVPAQGIEVYGELSREDFSGNGRWLLLLPDNLAQILVGITRTSTGEDGSLRVLRIEHVNGETAHHERAQLTLNRPAPPYVHHQIPQGLTSRGQVLGSSSGFGGSGTVIAFDRYTAAGRRSWSVERQLRQDWTRPMGNVGGSRHAETLLGLRYEQVRLFGQRELTLSIAPSRVLNRNVEAGNDLWNVELRSVWRGW
jgi:hypothetical protein